MDGNCDEIQFEILILFDDQFPLSLNILITHQQGYMGRKTKKDLKHWTSFWSKTDTSMSFITNKHGHSWLRSHLASEKILISLFTKDKWLLLFPINFFIILLQQSPWFDLKTKIQQQLLSKDLQHIMLQSMLSQVKEVVFQVEYYQIYKN